MKRERVTKVKMDDERTFSTLIITGGGFSAVIAAAISLANACACNTSTSTAQKTK